MLLRLLLLPFVLLGRLLLSPWRRFRFSRAAPPGALIEIRLVGLVRELPPRPDRLWPPKFLRRERPRVVHLRALRRLLTAVLADPRPAGVLVTIEHISGGWPSLDALRSELLRVREAGKAVVAWLPHGGGNRELFVASAATTIVAPRTADVALVGPKIEGHYARTALDRLGIDVELHARKEYKSAGDRVARDGRSDADRLQADALLDAVDELLVSRIATGRGVAEERVRQWIDHGPCNGERARERGLLDLTAHDDELATALSRTIVPSAKYEARRRVHARPLRLGGPQKAIGVVEVHGAITSAPSPISRALGPLAVAERVIADLRAAARDPSVVAVVLDIDSPGGTVLASDAIWAAARRLAEDKPVLARMADVAASGGYWIAMASDTIVAHPMTLTGSIGVVAIRPIAARLTERIGISRDALTRGRFADLDALTRAPTEEERAHFAGEIDAHYASFVAHVAAGRRKTVEQVEEVARGRVWTGQAALAVGLVDRLGGLDDALAVLRARVGGAELLDPEPRLVSSRGAVARAAEPRSADRPADRAALALAEWLLPGAVRAAVLPVAVALEARQRVAAIALVTPPT